MSSPSPHDGTAVVEPVGTPEPPPPSPSSPSPGTSRWTARRRSCDDLIAASEADPGRRLERRLGRGGLVAMGVGTIVGSGIFVLTGVAAATKAGPAITVSFVIAGVVCLLIALCYAELAATIPVSGSAYTYTSASLGEAPAFLVGWLLLLEFVVAGSAVAIGWSGTLSAALTQLVGVTLPAAVSGSPAEGGVVDLPAVLVVAVLVGLLLRRVTLTARVTAVLVVITVAVLVAVVGVGAPHVQAAHWTPFAPFGFAGIVGGAAIAFFSFLGFDVVATSAEESRRPQRDMPFAIVATVVIATVLYVAVAAVLTGLVPSAQLDTKAPVATALAAVHVGWVGTVVLVAMVVALTKGLLMILYGQTRLGFAMARDGLLPAALARTTATTRAPSRMIVVLGGLSAVIAGLVPIDVVAELVNIGALFAFSVVAVGVVVLRRREPDRPRPFRCPGVPVVPALAVLGCVALATTLAPLTWLWFAVWLVIGTGIYLGYGRRHSTLAGAAPAAESPAETKRTSA